MRRLAPQKQTRHQKVISVNIRDNDTGPCVACGADTARNGAPRAYQNHEFNTGGMFDDLHIIVCRDCGLGHASPSPANTDLARFYNDEYRSPKSPYYINYASSTRPQPGWRSIAQLSLATQYVAIGDGDIIVDVGAGSGASFESARLLWPQVRPVAIEVDDLAAQFFSEKLEVEVFPSLEDLAHSHNLAKLILMSHSLEHFSVEEIPSRLHRIGMCMHPDGALLIEVPHQDFRAQIVEPRSDAPHLTFFSPDALCRLLSSAGFTVLFVGRCGDVARPFEDIAVVRTVVQRAAIRYGSRIPRRAKTVLRQFNNALAPNYDRPDMRANLGYTSDGDCIRVVAQRTR